MTGQRVTPDEFEELVASYADHGARGNAAQSHHAEALAAVAAPMAMLRLRVAGPDRASLHQVWCSGAVSAVLLHVRDDTYELHTIATPFVPALLGRVTRLGPRRTRAHEDIPVSPGWIDAVMSADIDGRAPAWQELRAAPNPDLREAAQAGSLWAWTVDCAWPAPDDQPGQRRLAVVDGTAGTWIHDDSTLVPASAREVWRVLTRILPDDDELAPDVFNAG